MFKTISFPLSPFLKCISQIVIYCVFIIIQCKIFPWFLLWLLLRAMGYLEACSFIFKYLRIFQGGNDNLLWYSCLGNFMDRGVWWAAVHKDAESHLTEWLSTQAKTHSHVECLQNFGKNTMFYTETKNLAFAFTLITVLPVCLD